jgi:hypothetical protein
VVIFEAADPKSEPEEVEGKPNIPLLAGKNLLAAGVVVGVVDSAFVFDAGFLNIPWLSAPKILLVFAASVIEEVKPEPKTDFPTPVEGLLSSSLSALVSGLKLDVNLNGCAPKGFLAPASGLELGGGNEVSEPVSIETSETPDFVVPNMLGPSALAFDPKAANPPLLAKLAKPVPLAVLLGGAPASLEVLPNPD